MTIVYHRDFERNFKKLNPKIKSKFYERLIIFEKDEFNVILNNHALIGSYKGYRSINIAGDLRLLYKKRGNEAIFVTIGSHSTLYG